MQILQKKYKIFFLILLIFQVIKNIIKITLKIGILLKENCFSQIEYQEHLKNIETNLKSLTLAMQSFKTVS